MKSRKGNLTAFAGAVTLAIFLMGGVVVESTGVTNFSAAIGPQDSTDTDPSPGASTDMVSYNEFRELVGLKFTGQEANEQIVFIKDSVDAENLGSADVTSIGADSDEDDTTELFASSEVEEDEDYYVFSSFDQKLTSNLPPAGDYQVAVIGSGVANKYTDVTLNDSVKSLRTEQDAPIQPLQDVDWYAYGTTVSVEDTQVRDGDQGLAFSTDYTSNNADSDVDGSVTVQRTYSIEEGNATQFGAMSVENVNGNVSEVTYNVMVDGEQVHEVTDSDLSDGNKLDDRVEFGPETAQDTVTVEAKIKFDDTGITSATALLDTVLDDTDEDGSSDDGSYGMSAVSTTWTGY